MILWPKPASFITDKTCCPICSNPFGPQGGWSLGSCECTYHPMCVIFHALIRRFCAICKAPFHERLYEVFGLGHARQYVGRKIRLIYQTCHLCGVKTWFGVGVHCSIRPSRTIWASNLVGNMIQEKLKGCATIWLEQKGQMIGRGISFTNCWMAIEMKVRGSAN